ncbi:hypothetical protein KIN20_025026 [Parelaphostrongylus tenuis]|uniref:Uncharacterized protein n=1 Tax=Parelaphostrongylus tenuis TaxID=148309 RepID=A0AAD5ND46_PARTN|nr:hypothetical protein KIN20_025026 [Parelaphostrongylus tenuis]
MTIYQSKLLTTLDGQSTPNYHSNKENTTIDSEHVWDVQFLTALRAVLEDETSKVHEMS